jgi:hypothetical protein
LALGKDKLTSDQKIAEGRAKTQLDIETAKADRLARREESQNARVGDTKAAEAEEQQAQSDYDDTRLEFRDIAKNGDPAEIAAARQEMEAARQHLETVRKKRTTALRGGAPNSPTAPTRTGAAPSDIAATQPAQPGRGKPQGQAQLPQGAVMNPDGTMTYNGIVYEREG